MAIRQHVEGPGWQRPTRDGLSFVGPVEALMRLQKADGAFVADAGADGTTATYAVVLGLALAPLPVRVAPPASVIHLPAVMRWY